MVSLQKTKLISNVNFVEKVNIYFGILDKYYYMNFKFVVVKPKNKGRTYQVFKKNTIELDIYVRCNNNVLTSNKMGIII